MSVRRVAINLIQYRYIPLLIHYLVARLLRWNSISLSLCLVKPGDVHEVVPPSFSLFCCCCCCVLRLNKVSTAQRCSTLSALMAVRSFIFLIKNCSSLLLLLLLMMLGSTHPVGRPLSAAFPPIFQPFRNEKKKNNLIAWPSFIAVVDVCGCCRCPTFW